MKDVDIRTALASEINKAHRDASFSRIWSEFAIALGDSRADLCVINGNLTGYEIKSPRDKLSRLPAQIAHYDRVMDFSNIVVSEAHVKKAKLLTPAHWGVIIATPDTGGVGLHLDRMPSKNENVDPFSLAQLLHRDEGMHVLRLRNAHYGLSRATRWEVWDRLVEQLTIEDIQASVRSALKVRPFRLADAGLRSNGAMLRLHAR